VNEAPYIMTHHYNTYAFTTWLTPEAGHDIPITIYIKRIKISKSLFKHLYSLRHFISYIEVIIKYILEIKSLLNRRLANMSLNKVFKRNLSVKPKSSINRRERSIVSNISLKFYYYYNSPELNEIRIDEYKLDEIKITICHKAYK
jgi:hypothetical protein